MIDPAQATIEQPRPASGGKADLLHVEPIEPPDADVVIITDEGFEPAVLIPIVLQLNALGYGVKHIGIRRQSP